MLLDKVTHAFFPDQHKCMITKNVIRQNCQVGSNEIYILAKAITSSSVNYMQSRQNIQAIMKKTHAR